MSLVNTKMQELRVQSPSLDQWTNRPSRYGLFDVFMAGNNEPQSIISPQLLEEASKAVGRDVKIPVFDAETVSIGSTRSVTISDSENTSQLYQISFTTYAWGFTIVPGMFMNNEIAMQQDFNRKFLKYLYKFADTVDAACGSALSTSKSQVFADLLGYTNTGNVIVSPLANKDEILGDMSVIMKANDYYGGPYHVVGNTGMESQVKKMAEHGLYNDQNKQIQFDDKVFHFTNNISNDAAHKATGYIVNPGAVGMMWRHEREALLGTMMADGTEWNIDRLPMLGLPIDTYYYESKGSMASMAGAATADHTRGRKEHYGFAIELAYVVAYPFASGSGTVASPITKFAISKT